MKFFKKSRPEYSGTQPSNRTPWSWKLSLLAALAIPVFLETLDYTVVATAQTHIASVFNRLDLQSYIGTLYLLTSTVFLPLFASVADIYGRHSALQISLVFFIFGSAISTGGRNMPMVLAGRAIAGIGAAGLLSVVRIIMADTGSLDENNWQISILMFLYAIGYTVGPVIGGALVDANWRWVFAINLPCCVVSMVLIFILLRGKIQGGRASRTLPSYEGKQESAIQKLLRIDWIGTILFVAAGILVLLALNWGSTQRWNSARVIASFVVGGVLFIACIGWEHILERKQAGASPSMSRLFSAEAMLPLAVFRSYDVCAVQYASFITGMVMLVMFYFVAIFMTIVSGLSATSAGVQLLYFAPGMGAGTFTSIWMIKRWRQPKYPIWYGNTVVPIGLGLLSYGMAQNRQDLIDGFMVVIGFGVGLCTASLSVQARFSLGDEHVAIVSALTLFFRSLGGTVGLAQCAAVMNAKVNTYLVNLAKSGALSSSDVAALAQAASNGGLSSLQNLNSLPPALQSMVRDAFRNGTRWSFISLIPWAGLTLFLTVFLSNIPDTDRVEQASETESKQEQQP